MLRFGDFRGRAFLLLLFKCNLFTGNSDVVINHEVLAEAITFCPVAKIAKVRQVLVSWRTNYY